MLKKNSARRHLPSLLAAVMAVSATATGLTALSMTAFAGEELGEGTLKTERACLGTFVKTQLLS